MPSFEIATYTVETVHTGRTPVAYQRFIILEGSSEDQGAPENAVLIFMDDEFLHPDHAGFVTGSGVLYCVLRIRDFRDVYDILRSEKPVFCKYDSKTGSQTWIQITTNKEPVGEGPSDESNPRFSLPALLALDELQVFTRS